MAKLVSHWSLSEEAHVWTHASPWRICGGRSGSGKGFVGHIHLPLILYMILAIESIVKLNTSLF